MNTELVLRVKSILIEEQKQPQEQVQKQVEKIFYNKNRFFIQKKKNDKNRKFKIKLKYTDSFLEEGEINILSSNDNIDKITKSIIDSITTFKTNSRFLKIDQLKLKLILDEKGNLINILFYIRKNDIIERINIKTKTVNSSIFSNLLENKETEIRIKGISSIQNKEIKIEKEEEKREIPYDNILKI